LFKAIDDNASYLVERGNEQDIFNMAWAFAELGVDCPALFEAINDKSSYIVEQGSSRQAIANTALAFAQLGYRRALSSLMDSLAESGNVQAIVNLCYSFAILDVALEYETDFRILWNRALQFKGDDFGEGGASQTNSPNACHGSHQMSCYILWDP
jgi:hypothetical protein